MKNNTEKQAFTPRKSQGSYKPGETMQKTIDDAIRTVVRKRFGKPIPVIGCVGVRYNPPAPKVGHPYQRYILDNGYTVFVSLASGVVTVSEKPAIKASYTIAAWIARQSRKEARAKKAAAAKAEAK